MNLYRIGTKNRDVRPLVVCACFCFFNINHLEAPCNPDGSIRVHQAVLLSQSFPSLRDAIPLPSAANSYSFLLCCFSPTILQQLLRNSPHVILRNICACVCVCVRGICYMSCVIGYVYVLCVSVCIYIYLYMCTYELCVCLWVMRMCICVYTLWMHEGKCAACGDVYVFVDVHVCEQLKVSATTVHRDSGVHLLWFLVSLPLSRSRAAQLQCRTHRSGRKGCRPPLRDPISEIASLPGYRA